jgi:hypothetical protein
MTTLRPSVNARILPQQPPQRQFNILSANPCRYMQIQWWESLLHLLGPALEQRQETTDKPLCQPTHPRSLRGHQNIATPGEIGEKYLSEKTVTKYNRALRFRTENTMELIITY